jgi:hypothetical protein
MRTQLACRPEKLDRFRSPCDVGSGVLEWPVLRRRGRQVVITSRRLVRTRCLTMHRAAQIMRNVGDVLFPL